MSRWRSLAPGLGAVAVAALIFAGFMQAGSAGISAQEDDEDENGELAVVTEALPDGALGETYTAMLEATGGEEPYSWGIDGLPNGLEGSEGGLISGVPTETGDFDISVAVLDNTGTTASAELTLTVGVGVDAPPEPTPTPEDEIVEATPTATPTEEAEELVELEVTVTMDPDPIEPGQPVAFEITVTNPNGIDAEKVTVTLETPEFTTFASVTAPPGWVCDTPEVGGTGVIECDPGLAAGESASIIVELNVSADAPEGTQLSFPLVVESDISEPMAANVSAEVGGTFEPPATGTGGLTGLERQPAASGALAALMLLTTPMALFGLRRLVLHD